LVAFDENVSWFQVPMNIPRIDETIESRIELPPESLNFLFPHSALIPQILLKIPSLTVLRNNITIINSFIRINVS
jgi:hypothetical protein